jgi:hypothetical protein
MRGVAPSTARGAVIAVGELTTYDHTKFLLKDSGLMNEGFYLHAVASLITGVVATTVAAPFDLLKTRVMNDGSGCGGAAPQLYRGAADCFAKTVKREGPRALMKGWWPAYCRLGPHALIQFPLLEQIRCAMGLVPF